MKIHDISQPLGPATAVWPGDTPVSVAWTMRRERGEAVNVAAVTLSVHAGTHADGPLHVSDGAAPAGSLALEPFLGPALLVDATGAAELDEAVLAGVDLSGVERVLFRTRDRVDHAVFPDQVAAVRPGFARRLAEAGIRLVGTDAPSVDPLDSTSLEAHRVLADGGVVHLENLVLTGLAPGRYTLVALPLRLEEADSAPVRAVLLQEEEYALDPRAGGDAG